MSRLLIRPCTRAVQRAAGAGVTLQVSYTRVDERGSCYLAANWIPVAICRGRGHTTGNRTARWLPGFYDPGTEIVDRVRWERGERAQNAGVTWSGERWEARAQDRERFSADANRPAGVTRAEP